MKFVRNCLVAAIAVSALLAAPALARDRIRIVGSSTVFPFATAVAERFGKITEFETPVIESTGSGGGLKLFCAGVGLKHPDVTNSSRRIKATELKLCMRNGVDKVVEAIIGYDGIVIANARGATEFDLTLEQVYLALAKEVSVDGNVVANPHNRWSDIDPSLPDQTIEVLGPPPTSGTRDAFEELAMQGGCKKSEAARAADIDCKKVAIRDDGPWIDAGENDNLIVSKLTANSIAVGVFGFSFLDQNAGKLKGGKINGVNPNFENVANASYPISRSLFFYVKMAHVGTIPGIQEYVSSFLSPAASGPDGYLVDKGLIPLPDDEFAANADLAMSLTPMTGEENLK